MQVIFPLCAFHPVVSQSIIAAAAGVQFGTDHDRGMAAADFDNDGDLDIFFTNTGQNSILLENLGPFNNWIDFRLRGSGSNLNGVGAKLTAWVNGRPQAQAIIAGQGYLGTGSDLNAHWVLGTSRFLDSLVVKWPSGTLDKYYHLAANQKLTLYAGNAPPSDRTAPKISSMNAHNVGTTTVTINWQTDENADAQIEYGRDTNYGSLSALDNNFATTHDTQAPVISNLAINAITANSAQIKWDADEPSEARVEYGTDSMAFFAAVQDTNFVTAHTVSLVNLKTYTTYYFRITTKDKSGNSLISRHGRRRARPWRSRL